MDPIRGLVLLLRFDHIRQFKIVYNRDIFSSETFSTRLQFMVVALRLH